MPFPFSWTCHMTCYPVVRETKIKKKKIYILNSSDLLSECQFTHTHILKNENWWVTFVNVLISSIFINKVSTIISWKTLLCPYTHQINLHLLMTNVFPPCNFQHNRDTRQSSHPKFDIRKLEKTSTQCLFQHFWTTFSACLNRVELLKVIQSFKKV